MSVAKITVHTVKCTGAYRNFSSATSNYSNAVVCVHAFIFNYNFTHLRFGELWEMKKDQS